MDTVTLAQAARRYSEYATNARQIREASKSGVVPGKGNPLWEALLLETTAVLVNAVRATPALPVYLYRGIIVPEGSDVQLTPGLSAFSANPAWAAVYTEIASREIGGGARVLLHLVGSARTLPTDPLTGLLHHEYLVAGSFEITRVDGPRKIGIPPPIRALMGKGKRNMVRFDQVIQLRENLPAKT